MQLRKVNLELAVRNYAKNKAIEYHGMLWILDKLVELGIIGPQDASVKLNTLINRNMNYQNNAELVKEMLSDPERHNRFIRSGSDI